jgi:membrane-associated phospholipid phosphatase
MEKKIIKNNNISLSTDISNNNNEDNDGLKLLKINNETNYFYFSKIYKKNKIKLFYSLFFIILIFIFELIFREKLFDFSVRLEKKCTNNFLKNFFIFITEFGGEYMMVIIFLTFYFVFSLIDSFMFISGFIKCIYFINILKIIYGNKRPFWDNENENLLKYKCDGGYGNPSGHSFISTYVYLSFYFILSKNELIKNKKILKNIFLGCSLLLILLIMLSRVYLGLHTINQIIYGSLLGLFSFYLDYFVFEIINMDINYYKKLFKSKKIMKIFIISILICLVLLLLAYLIFNKKNIKKYNSYLDDIPQCQKLKDYRRLNKEGLFANLLIFFLIGMYFGQMFFWKMLEKKYFEEINTKNIKNNNFKIKWIHDLENIKKNPKVLIKIFCIFIFCFFPSIIFSTQLLFENYLILIFLISYSVPLFSISFLLFGPGMYFMVKEVE